MLILLLVKSRVCQFAPFGTFVENAVRVKRVIWFAAVLFMCVRATVCVTHSVYLVPTRTAYIRETNGERIGKCERPIFAIVRLWWSLIERKMYWSFYKYKSGMNLSTILQENKRTHSHLALQKKFVSILFVLSRPTCEIHSKSVFMSPISLSVSW